MYIRCILCSFLVFFLTLTKASGVPLSQTAAIQATKLENQPQTHILSLVKPNKSNLKHLKQDNNDLAHNWHRRQQTKAKLIRTDDLLDTKKNTLESTNDEFSRQRNDGDSGIYLRFKQSIPVLEPVRHLLNTVREGGFNHTAHFNKTRHQLIGAGEVGGNMRNSGNTGDVDSSSASSAIETEAERDMVLHGSESTGFQLLDFFGTIGGMIWGFLMNIKKWFAASSSGSF